MTWLARLQPHCQGAIIIVSSGFCCERPRPGGALICPVFSLKTACQVSLFHRLVGNPPLKERKRKKKKQSGTVFSSLLSPLPFGAVGCWSQATFSSSPGHLGRLAQCHSRLGRSSLDLSPLWLAPSSPKAWISKLGVHWLWHPPSGLISVFFAVRNNHLLEICNGWKGFL